MQKSDVSNVLIKWTNTLIESWFDPMLQPIIKGLVQSNISRVDGIVNAFTDDKGEVFLDAMLAEYENLIPSSGYNIDAKRIFGDNLITRNISVKVLEKSDIKLLKNLLNEVGKQTIGVGKAE